MTVLMEDVSSWQTLSDDMSGWLNGSKQGIALFVCSNVSVLFWSLEQLILSSQKNKHIMRELVRSLH